MLTTDATLGHCTSFAIRLMFLRQHIVDDRTKGRGPEPDKIDVGTLRDLLQSIRLPARHDTSLSDLLHVSVASFCDDIVTPYSVARNLPLIVLCEPFDDAGDDPSARPPREVQIDLPEHFEMLWEKNRVLSIPFPQSRRRIAAKLVDSVTFFASGVFAYSVSFIFGGGEAAGTELDPNLALVLSAVAARPAGELLGDSVRFSLGDRRDGKPLPLAEFLRDRLTILAAERESSFNIFSLLDGENVSSVLQGSSRTARDIGAIRESLLALFPATGDFEGRTLVDMEILGSSSHDKVLKYAELSGARCAPVDDFSKALAGLTQNVLDYAEQDEEEIHDSLSGGLTIGSDITFVSKDVAVKFCRASRVTSEMRSVVGGSPYWMLVQLVMGHNEALLSDLAAGIDHEFGQAGLISAFLASKDPHDVRKARERSDQALYRKIRLAYYIPNLFRYPTEQKLYDYYSRGRGLGLRRDYLIGSESAWEDAMRQTSTVTKEQADRTFNMTLIALGVVQIGGVLAAIAAIDDKHFWYVTTHVLDPGEDWRAIRDTVGAFVFGGLHRQGEQPADVSAAWALAVAVGLIVGGSYALGRLWWRLWLSHLPLSRMIGRKLRELPMSRAPRAGRD